MYELSISMYKGCLEFPHFQITKLANFQIELNFAVMTIEHLKSMRDRVLVLGRFL